MIHENIPPVGFAEISLQMRRCSMTEKDKFHPDIFNATQNQRLNIKPCLDKRFPGCKTQTKLQPERTTVREDCSFVQQRR
ncbi:MAG: hypothetical protein MI799_07065, partial [Desulfobacterales bacterium]|nr:hypothetical protein [Desulfobacterales bacterium]